MLNGNYFFNGFFYENNTIKKIHLYKKFIKNKRIKKNLFLLFFKRKF